MGNSSSKYDPMLSNMPPGYIPTWPAVPPWKIKKKRWNPFRSKKHRDAEMRQWYYTTPFVYQYPPGSSYPFPNPVGQGTTYPSQSAAAMPVPNPALPPALVYERSSRRRRRRSRSPDSGSDSASYDEEGRYRRPYRSGSYGGSRHNPLPAPPKDVLASTPYRHIFRQLPSIRSGSQSRYDYPYDYNRDRDRDRDRDREYRRRHRDRDRDRGRGRDVDLEYARDRDRDYRDQDVERRRAEDRYERDRERREREQARAERERERQEREMANAERAAEHAQRGYDQQDREMEEREREREIRAAVEPGFRPLRRQHGLSFTEQVAGGLAGIFGRGPRMPEPEPTGEGIPRSPVPHGGGYGGIPVSPMGFPPVIPSSTAGPPPAPPAFITPVGGAGVGMPQPGVPGIVPGVVPPTAGMGMPTPEVPGRMMATPAPPGGMSMPMPGVPGSGMPMPTPSMAGGTTPVIPGHNIAVPGGFMSSPSRPSSGMPYPIPVPLAGGSGGPPSSAFTSGPRVSISGYEYPELMAQSRDQVLYDDDLYPTALHLFEAFKFLPHRPDVAEMIRQSSNHEISEVSERHQQAVRPDWDQVALQMMDEALYYKFRQHTNARDILLATGTAPLLFQDAGDSFWGGGPDDLGDNQMGHSLERVRQRLRDDMAR